MINNSTLFGQLRIHAVTLLGMLLVTVVSVSAQLPTGTILGTVKDTNGGTIAGAEVIVTNSDTGLTRTGTTEDDGTYRFPALAVGQYEVQVTKGGFQKAVHKGLTLQVAQAANVDFSL